MESLCCVGATGEDLHVNPQSTAEAQIKSHEERSERRSKAIKELDDIGQDLIKQLGIENAFKDPYPPSKTRFISSLTISKDPRSCPTLFFHDNEYFKMVCILPRTPTCVMPIVVNETSLHEVVQGYNLDTTTTDIHLTFRYVVRRLVDTMMGKALGRRRNLEATLDKLGRAPTPYKYREVYLDLRTEVEEMDVYLDKILKEIIDRISAEENRGREKRMRALPTMTARITSLPRGISRQGVEYARIHRPEIVKAVKNIVLDGVKEVHSNGDAKLWGMSILNILRLSMAAKTTDSEKERRILDWEASIGAGGERGDLASCFQHCRLMRDTNPGQESDLMWYPPEPFFSHPIAKAVADQLRNKEVLELIPPSHHHTHDYVLHSNGVMCVVGEAQSGTDFRAELDKCLPGMCKALAIQKYSIGITSSQTKSSIHLGHIGGIVIHGSHPVQSLLVDSITVRRDAGEGNYGTYIDNILDALETFVGLHVASDIFVKVPRVHFLHPGFELDAVSGRSYDITVPGLYLGLNAAYVKDRYPAFYPIWIEGHANCLNKIAYPASILCTPDSGAFVNFMPMECESHKPGATALDSDVEGVTAEEIAETVEKRGFTLIQAEFSEDMSKILSVQEVEQE